MTESIYELYGEIWDMLDEEVQSELDSSLNPRSAEMLYDYLNDFGIKAEQKVLDIGGRHAKQSIEIARRYGCKVELIDPILSHIERAKANINAAALTERITARKAKVESLPFDDEGFNHIWCRDVLNHADLKRGLAESYRVLNYGGMMLVYQTFATALMESQEAKHIYDAMSIVEMNMSPEYFESAAKDVGFLIVRKESLGSEWRENGIESGDNDILNDLLKMSRLQRKKDDFVAKFGITCYETTYADCAWGVYQFLGKLNPTVYILEKLD